MATETTNTIARQDFGQEVAPYAQDVLGRAQYLTGSDKAGNRNVPYKKYTGERIAQFDPLQTQAFDAAKSLGQNQNTKDAATGIAGLAKKAGDVKYDKSAYKNQYKDPQAPVMGAAMAPAYLTPQEIGEMLVGKKPNPNNFTLQDMIAAGKYQAGMIKPPENLAKKNADGTPVMAPKLDSEGKPVMEPQKNADGTPMTQGSLGYTAKDATAKEAGLATLPIAETAKAATMGKAPTGIAAIAEAKQDLNAPQMTAQTGESAKGIAALNKATPEMKAQAANAATLSAAPEAAQQQFAGPKDVKAQQVREERINAPDLKDLRMDAAKDVTSQGVQSRDINAAQMGPAERVETKSFAQPGSADAYMSPYMQSVVGIQQREAQRAADVATTGRRGEQTRAGAFGGSRAAIMDAEAARNLATQKGDIQAQGSQEAYKQAQQQFNTEQAQGLQAQTANQQAGLTVGTQNLTAQQQTNVQNEANRLQAQGLTSSQAMQAALANQGVEQQSNVQNLSAGLQKQGLGAQIGMQAQQSNQQYNMQGKLANQQTDLAAQQANQGMEYNTNAQNAQLRQQTELANQGQRGQYGMQQGQFNQAANMQTSAQAQEAARQNQAMAGQYGLSDTGNRQQTNMADAGYAQQTGMANLANRQEAQRQNQASNSQYGLANLANRQQAEMTNAGYRQQTGMADQALAGQYGMQQGTMDQQAAMQSAANRQAAQMYYGQAQNERDQYNTTNKQQTELANQAARNRAEEFGAGQELTSAQYNAQYGLSADQLNEQSNQYGAGYGLQGMQAGMTGYGNLSNVGNTLYGQDTGAMNMQNQYGTQRQNNATGILQNQYGDWQAEQNDPYKQVSFYSDVVRGMPATAASNTMSSSPAPSMLSQVGGFGAAALGAYGASGGFKSANGGMIGRYAKGGLVRSRPQGLVALAIHSMT